jgi:DivIVA protein
VRVERDRDHLAIAEHLFVSHPARGDIRVESFDRRGVIMDRPLKRRGPGSRLATLGSRLVRPPLQEYGPSSDYGVPEPYAAQYAEPPVARYPISRQGYDCHAVDAHVAELEGELAELERQLSEARLHVTAKSEVAREIDRIGEQTSAILVAAHDEAQQTVRLAESHANTVIADAASYAAALTEEANTQLRAIEARTQSVSSTRERLIDDVRLTARALNALADEGSRSLPNVQVDSEQE